MKKMNKQCWSCKNYRIGVNPFSDILGIEYCELELDGYDGNCDKYQYDSNYNRYDNIDNVDEIPF